MLSTLRTPSLSRSSSERSQATRPSLETLEGRTLLHGTHLMVMAPPTVTLGGDVAVTVKAVDDAQQPVSNYLGTVHFTSSDTGAVLPADYTFTTADSGSHVFTFRLATAGQATITATDTTDPVATATASVTVVPASLHHFDVSMAETVIAGSPTSVTVSARDAAGNLVQDFVGPVHFETTDGGAKLPADHTITAAERGSFTTTIALATTGRHTIKASNGPVQGQTQVNVAPGTPVSFSLSVAPRLTVDQPVELRLRALDSNGNVVTWYTGTVHLASNDTTLTLPADYTFRPQDGGQTTFQITPRTTGDFLVNVNDTAQSHLRGGAFLAVRFGSENHNYLSALYRELLGRSLDGSGLAHWGGLLDAGAPHEMIVSGIQNSLEYRTKIISDLYILLLDREADAGGLQFYAETLGRGVTFDNIVAQFLGSQEYFDNRGAGIVEGYVASIYVDILNRQPDNATIGDFEDRLARGLPRDHLVRELMVSREAEELLVNDVYLTYLNRLPDGGGLTNFVAARQRGLSSEGLVLSLLASDEFFRKNS